MRWLFLWIPLALLGMVFLPVGFWFPLALIPLLWYLWRTERDDRRLHEAFVKLVENYHAPELDRE